jgi:hypothetical protein
MTPGHPPEPRRNWTFEVRPDDESVTNPRALIHERARHGWPGFTHREHGQWNLAREKGLRRDNRLPDECGCADAGDGG